MSEYISACMAVYLFEWLFAKLFVSKVCPPHLSDGIRKNDFEYLIIASKDGGKLR